MLLSIANLTNGLRGLKHNDDVPAHRFHAAGREPQATRRCRCSTKWSSGNTYSAKSINKARVSTWCTPQDFWLVELFCTKPSLFIKQEREEARLIRIFLEGDKRVTSPKY